MKKNFYRAFEDKYRGSRELIRGRLDFYRPFIEPLVAEFGRVPAIDLGCGRGEWLEVMLSAGFDARGIDLDAGMLQSCVDLGLPAEKGEAIAHLRALPAKSQAIVSAFHVVEHIPFDALQELVNEAKRVLLPGGLLILETPNPENIMVATCSFYLDPTHQRPIPPNLLSFVAEHAGFERVKVIRLQESKELAAKPDLLLEDVLGGVSPDYSVVAQKKGKKSTMSALSPAFSQDYGLTLSGLSASYDAHMKGKAGEERLKLMQERFESKKAVLDSRLTTLSSEHSALFTSHSALVAERDVLASERSTLDARLSTLTAERDSLATERDALQQQLHEIHQANHGHWQLAESLKQELAAKEQTWFEERSTLDSRLSTLSAEHSLLVAERNELATRHQLLATECAALTARVEEVAGQAAVARAHGESLKQELAAKEQTWSLERSTLDTRLSTLKAEHAALEEKLQEHATRYSLLVAERDAQSVQLSTLEQKLVGKDEVLDATREALVLSETSVRDQKQRAELLERKCDEARESIASAQFAQQEMKEWADMLNEELEQSLADLAAIRETLSAERSTFAARLSTLDSEKALLLTEHHALSNRLSLLGAERDALRQKLASNQESWAAERSTLAARLSTLSSEHSSLSASHSTLVAERDALAARHSTLVSEHEALSSELHNVHQANHGHWQLAESLKQELAAKEQAGSEERSTLDARLSTLDAERDTLATSLSLLVSERDALLASTCWRITAPIRWMRGGVRIPWPAPNEPLDDFFLKHAALYIRRRPHLKERALQFLFRNPKWHARVLQVLQGIKVSAASPIAFQPIPQPLQLPQPVPQPDSLHEISPPQESPAEIAPPASEEYSVAHSIQANKSVPSPLIAASRPKILQLTNYSIVTPDHGGKLRCYNIRESLRKYFDVETLSVEVADNDSVRDYSVSICAKDLYAQIGDGCFQDWASAHYLIVKQSLWNSVRQVVCSYNPDAILLEQPFLFPIFQKLKEDGALQKNCILINSSQNNEVDLKRGIYEQILGKKEAAKKLEIVSGLESEATRSADVTIAVSEQDLDYFKRISTAGTFLLYRNGHSGIKTTHAINKWISKFSHAERNFVVVGSWHMPNILGLKRLLDAGLMALKSGKIKLWVFGGMGPGLLSTFSLSISENSPLEIIGQTTADDIDSAIMASSGVILPIWDGSGSNLKTAQALLSGKTIIGTNFAFRGLEAFSTESGVDIRDDAKSILEAMQSVEISEIHKRPQAVAHLRWDNLLKNLPHDISKCMGYTTERYTFEGALYFDLTTLARWKGNPTGIARVISHLGSAMLAAYPEMKFTIFCRASGKFHFYNINQNQEAEAINFHPNDIIFSAGANWDDEGFEDAVKNAQHRGAKYSLLFYDVIPCILPHSFGPGFSDKFTTWFEKSIQLSDSNFAISNNTRKDLIELASKKSLSIAPTTVVRLGDTIQVIHQTDRQSHEKLKTTRGKFIISVGTLEYRKNHIVLINAYRLLLQSGVANIPKLIIVGGQGWMDSDILFQIQHDKHINKHIEVLSGISDAQLADLYKNCLFTVYPALYEGWGLPVSESLGYGKICITSRSSSMVEIAPHLTPFANPLNPEEWAEQISRLINNRDLLAKESGKIHLEYKLTKWSHTASTVLEALEIFSRTCHQKK